MTRTALFVIDIQGELAQDPSTEIPHAKRIREVGDAILAKARGAIDGARTNGQHPNLEIVIVQHEEKPEEGTMIRGSKPWELVFAPREGDNAEIVVAKDVRELPELFATVFKFLSLTYYQSGYVWIESSTCFPAQSPRGRDHCGLWDSE
jgi:nicotinamidase-related amidase